MFSSRVPLVVEMRITHSNMDFRGILRGPVSIFPGPDNTFLEQFYISIEPAVVVVEKILNPQKNNQR